MDNNRFILIAAVVTGITATGLAFAYLKKATVAAAPAQVESSVEILATARDLPGNTRLEPDTDVQVIKVPEETFAQLAKSAVKRTERASLRGRKIAGPLPSGTPLLYSHLAAVTDLTITPGSRAMTIPAPQIGPNGQISADYMQSIVGAAINKGMAGSGGGEWEATIVLANVKVLAVGTSLQKSRTEMLFGQSTDTSTGRYGGGTVTVEVTLDEALQLIKSTAGNNPVTLLLRTERTEGN
jgi:Flp pilus assembly protein CpaB